MSNPVITLRYLGPFRRTEDEYETHLVEVLWAAQLETGDYVSLLVGVPDCSGYVFTVRDDPFTDGQETDGGELGTLFELGRPAAGQLAIALITALINNSDQIIDYYSNDVRSQLLAARRHNVELQASMRGAAQG